MAGELASRAIQPLIFVVLARLLTPGDYGIMAAAVMVISFTQVFWEAGMGKALIQRQDKVTECANLSFWINIVLGIIIGLLLILLSDKIAITFFNDIAVGKLLRVMTIQIVLGALGSVPTALLQKEMKFNKLFWVRISTVAIPGLFSIPLAYMGYSYWALVIGTLVGQAAQVVVLWVTCDWRPSFRIDLSVARGLLTFGAWVGLTGILSWFYIWIDSLFVGAYLGTHDLGLYRTGNQFVTMIFGFLFGPLLPVLYSYLSGLQYEQEKLRTFFLRVIRIISFISIPLSFVIFSLGPEIGMIAFGGKWQGIGLVISVLSIMHGFSWVVGVNGEVYRAIGKPSYETIVNITALAIYLVGYYISIRQGFEVFIWTRLALAVFAMILHIGFAWMAVRLRIIETLRIILVCSGIGAIAVVARYALRGVTENPYLIVTMVGSLSALGMLIAIFALERNGFVKDFLSLLKKDL